MNRQRRILAVHDISCVGRCSLTVALPIISAAGIETSVLPTAVLSTHTGGFNGFTYRDLTEDIRPIEQHWKSLDLSFDAIYTGFLGSFEQLELVGNLFDDFRREDSVVLVDPVMADNGQLYKSFTPDFVKGMAGLCAKADTIVPNMTEALFMLGETYQEGPYEPSYIEKLLTKLSALGPQRVVLTGVYLDDEHLGAACFDKATGEVSFEMASKVDGYYHGTGDVFGSALLGAMVRGLPLHLACRAAVDFTVESILRTKAAKTDVRYGVNFEESLPSYMKSLKLL